MKVTVYPWLQTEAWSLYWKESMRTESRCLDKVELELNNNTTVGEVQAKVAEALGWAPANELQRLEGFAEDWERVIYRGRELRKDDTLKQAGIDDQCPLTAVRKQLVAEGWKLKTSKA